MVICILDISLIYPTFKINFLLLFLYIQRENLLTQHNTQLSIGVQLYQETSILYFTVSAEQLKPPSATYLHYYITVYLMKNI